jgi:hypothetical protein
MSISMSRLEAKADRAVVKPVFPRNTELARGLAGGREKENEGGDHELDEDLCRRRS